MSTYHVLIILSELQVILEHFFSKNIYNNTINSNLLKCDTIDHYATILFLSNLQKNVKKSSNIINLNKINVNNLKLLNITY